MARICMLSTIDNPFNPFDDFTSWHLFDIEKGYQSCERLARIALTTDDMSQKEIYEVIERAIDEIIQYDILNIYIKVTKEVTDSYYTSTEEE